MEKLKHEYVFNGISFIFYGINRILSLLSEWIFFKWDLYIFCWYVLIFSKVSLSQRIKLKE